MRRDESFHWQKLSLILQWMRRECDELTMRLPSAGMMIVFLLSFSSAIAWRFLAHHMDGFLFLLFPCCFLVKGPKVLMWCVCFPVRIHNAISIMQGKLRPMIDSWRYMIEGIDLSTNFGLFLFEAWAYQLKLSSWAHLSLRADNPWPGKV